MRARSARSSPAFDSACVSAATSASMAARPSAVTRLGAVETGRSGRSSTASSSCSFVNPRLMPYDMRRRSADGESAVVRRRVDHFTHFTNALPAFAIANVKFHEVAHGFDRGFARRVFEDGVAAYHFFRLGERAV